MNNEKINILLVDDHPENLLTLEAILENEEYNLIKANSGDEALKYLLKNNVALILLDVQMPGIDGFTTAKIIKAREKTKHVPILFITANYLDAEHVFMGYSVGAIDYILKPFDPMILASKVERFVEIHKLKQQLEHQSETLLQKNKVIEHMAYYDSLTELPNRRKFYDTLVNQFSDAKTGLQPFGVMLLNLDRFKQINDTLGHMIADNLLLEVSKRISTSVRQHDFVARVGGDEFYFILPDTNREISVEVAEEILDSFKAPFIIGQYEFYVSASIGLAVFPFDGEDSTTLIKKADAALYRAKEQGQNKYNVYHSGMNIHSYRSFLIQNDLRKAIERDEFYLVYQPRVNLLTGDVTSAEALIRWNHPVWGAIKPEEFIPIAEETGLIIEIDQWVFENVCKQINQWKENELSLQNIRIAINLSAQHFIEKDFLANFINIFNQYKIDSNNIEFEITELVILRNEEAVQQTLQSIKELGIKLSLDDFGTGYSSLTYLRNFPFDSIKIDKSFIDDLPINLNNSKEIIESVIFLANKINMSVIAEGVETIQQLDHLKTIGCEEVQGYIFSPPVQSDQFIQYVKSNERQVITNRLNESSVIVMFESTERITKKEDQLNSDVIQLAIQQLKNSYSLSNREQDVFRLIVEGLSNKEISERLFISEHTVKNHITNILHKFGVSDRVQVISKVYEACIKVEKI